MMLPWPLQRSKIDSAWGGKALPRFHESDRIGRRHTDNGPHDHDLWRFVLIGVFLYKLDGFRALAYLEKGACWLVSRNRNAFKTFEALAQAIGQDLSCRSAILDGEIVRSGPDGRPMFYELMRRRGPFCFYALRSRVAGRARPAGAARVERKARLRKLLKAAGPPAVATNPGFDNGDYRG
jgi:ATP-dependent DNA ligase